MVGGGGGNDPSSQIMLICSFSQVQAEILFIGLRLEPQHANRYTVFQHLCLSIMSLLSHSLSL